MPAGTELVWKKGKKTLYRERKNAGDTCQCTDAGPFDMFLRRFMATPLVCATAKNIALKRLGRPLATLRVFLGCFRRGSQPTGRGEFSRSGGFKKHQTLSRARKFIPQLKPHTRTANTDKFSEEQQQQQQQRQPTQERDTTTERLKNSTYLPMPPVRTP